MKSEYEMQPLQEVFCLQDLEVITYAGNQFQFACLQIQIAVGEPGSLRVPTFWTFYFPAFFQCAMTSLDDRAGQPDTRIFLHLKIQLLHIEAKAPEHIWTTKTNPRWEDMVFIEAKPGDGV